MAADVRYGIAELADLGDVSRRTVRYYVQEALLPAPLGVGRGDHYGPAHLERLLQVKALQQAGKSLEEIRQLVSGGDGARALAASAALDAAAPRAMAARARVAATPTRETWRRIRLAPGIELHVSADVRLPSTARLQQLAEWCRLHLTPDPDRDREDSDA